MTHTAIVELMERVMKLTQENHEARSLLTSITTHLETYGFPFGRAHGPTCECEHCEAWTDLCHARKWLGSLTVEIETNPSKL